MKKNKCGFSLLELMIALTISALILSGLFTTLYQVSRSEASINTITDVHQKAAILFNHLERDLMGAFIPEQVDPIKRVAKDASASAQTSSGTQGAPKQVNEIVAEPIDKIFYGTSPDDTNMKLLTFVSDNPLEIYLGIKNSKPRPRTVRIVYRLEPQEGVKNAFVLTRQEGTSLSFQEYTKKTDAQKTAAQYQMIDNIASLSITYYSPEKKQDNANNATGEEQKKEYKKEKKWESEVKKENSEQMNYALPEFVELSLVLWDQAHEKKFDFMYTIPIMFKKGKPKRKKQAQPRANPMRVARKSKRRQPPTIAVADGSKVSISRSKDGKFIIEQVPA